MVFNHLQAKLASIPSYITKNRFGFGLRLFFRNYFKLPIIIQTKKGANIFLGFDSLDDIILKELNGRLESVYFPPEISLVKEDVVWDVGGHHGIFAVELAAKFPGINVFSFEPDDLACKYFKFNLVFNSKFSILLINAALDINSQKAYIIKSEEGSWGNYVQLDKQENSRIIRTLAVSDVLFLYSIKKIKYVKFNAEGAEFTVIPELFRLHVFPEWLLVFAHPEKGDVDGLVQLINSYSYVLVRRNDDSNRPWFFFNHIA